MYISAIPKRIFTPLNRYGHPTSPTSTSPNFAKFLSQEPLKKLSGTF